MNATGAVQAGKGPDPRAELRKASRALEAVFLNQLMQAMRASIPESGVTEHSGGEQMFTAMLDEKFAEAGAGRNGRGISEALYRQLSRFLPPESAGPERPAGATNR